MLEAALFRPQTGYYGDVILEAAALWESLTQNHPFVDGNKRTAFAVTYTFLAINGVRITADADATYTLISGALEAGNFQFDILADWLRKNTEFLIAHEVSVAPCGVRPRAFAGMVL